MQNQLIPENVVLAIEPGIYLPNKFGIRIEDDVLVGKLENEKLTNAPNELLCI
jgi:Xaa-Pro aminopeptidase